MFDFDDEKIEFRFRDCDFTDGKLNFELVPEFKAKFNKQGNLINTDEADKYHEAKEKNKIIKKFSYFQRNEALWENYDRLSPNQQKAITLLVGGVNIRDTAKECNINEATLYRWLQIDIFTKTLKLWQKNLLIEADIKLKSLVSKALERLEFVLDNPSKFESRDYLKAIELSLNFLNRGEDK